MSELSDDLYERTLSALTQALLRRSLLPAYSAPSDLERTVAMYEINARALESHQLEPYEGDVIFVAPGTGDLSAAEVVAQWGWAGLLGDVALVRAQGDHHTFMTNNSAGLAASLDAVLPRLTGPGQAASRVVSRRRDSDARLSQAAVARTVPREASCNILFG